MINYRGGSSREEVRCDCEGSGGFVVFVMFVIEEEKGTEREERRRHSQVWLCTGAVSIENVFGAVRTREVEWVEKKAGCVSLARTPEKGREEEDGGAGEKPLAPLEWNGCWIFMVAEVSLNFKLRMQGRWNQGRI